MDMDLLLASWGTSPNVKGDVPMWYIPYIKTQNTDTLTMNISIIANINNLSLFIFYLNFKVLV